MELMTAEACLSLGHEDERLKNALLAVPPYTIPTLCCSYLYPLYREVRVINSLLLG